MKDHSALSTAIAATQRSALFLVAVAAVLISSSLLLGIASTDAQGATSSRDHRANRTVRDHRASTPGWGKPERPGGRKPTYGGVPTQKPRPKEIPCLGNLC